MKKLHLRYTFLSWLHVHTFGSVMNYEWSCMRLNSWNWTNLLSALHRCKRNLLTGLRVCAQIEKKIFEPFNSIRKSIFVLWQHALLCFTIFMFFFLIEICNLCRSKMVSYRFVGTAADKSFEYIQTPLISLFATLILALY